MKKTMLLIGGTGVVGKAMIEEAIKEDYEVTVLTLKKTRELPQFIKQIEINRKNRGKFEKTCLKINKNKTWDIVFDIIALEKEDVEQTYNCFKDNCKHFFILSTTLVYDRSQPFYKRIPSNYPLAKRGTLGGYVDHKLEIEGFWRSLKNSNWTILRPYHVIGPEESLLGCIPDHNRDPELVERIKRGETLELCNGGAVKLNFIDARDLAKIVLKASGNKKTFGKAYNAVNPEIFLAREYYVTIGKILGRDVKIFNKHIKFVWEDNKGWQLTTLPNIYDVSDLERDIGFVPRTSLKRSLRDSIKNSKKIDKPISLIPVHQRMTLPPRPKKIPWLLKAKFDVGIIIADLRHEVKKSFFLPIFIIIYAAFLLFLLVLLVWTDFRTTLRIIGADYINWGLILILTMGLVLTLLLLYSSNYLKEEEVPNKLFRAINGWLFLAIYLMLVGFVISGSLLLSLYPGATEVNTAYSWKFSDEGLRQNLSNKLSNIQVKAITNQRDRFFVEGSIYEFSFSLYDDDYLIDGFEFNQKSIDRVLQEDKHNCRGKECIFRKTILEGASRFDLIVYTKNPETGGIPLAFKDFYPDVITPEERKKRDLDTFLILGSLWSVIILASLTSVNQFRQIVENRH